MSSVVGWMFAFVGNNIFLHKNDAIVLSFHVIVEKTQRKLNHHLAMNCMFFYYQEKGREVLRKPLKNACGNWSSLFCACFFFSRIIWRDKATQKNISSFYCFWLFLKCTLNIWTATAQGHTHKLKANTCKTFRNKTLFFSFSTMLM